MSYTDITICVGAHERVMIGLVERHAEVRLRGDSRIITPIIGVLQGMGLISTLKPPEMPKEEGDEESSVVGDALGCPTEVAEEETDTK